MLHKAILSASVLMVPWCLIAAILATAQEAESVPVEIVSDGAALQARFYRAECESTCPTLLLIPGFPGSAQPDVLGVGARLSTDGLNVLVVNPRGLHESEGTMSFFNTLDDIGAAFEWLHDVATVERFDVDTSAVVIGGHSFGGGMAMAYAAREPRVRAVVSLAGTDHGVFIRLYQDDATFAEQIGGFIRSTQAPEGPARFDFDATIRELAEHQEVFGLQENAAMLAGRSILLIGGWEDTNTTVDDYMLPLYRALRGAGAQDVTFLVYHDNHGFGQVRQRLANDVRDWVLRTADHNE